MLTIYIIGVVLSLVAGMVILAHDKIYNHGKNADAVEPIIGVSIFWPGALCVFLAFAPLFVVYRLAEKYYKEKKENE